MHLIINIHIQIIFKVLEHIHVLLHKVVLSNTCKLESFVIELPCVNKELTIEVRVRLADVAINPKCIVEESRI